MHLAKDSKWAISSKCKLWRRINGKLLIGGKNHSRWWFRTDDAFVKSIFLTEMSAMIAANNPVGAVDQADWWAAQ